MYMFIAKTIGSPVAQIFWFITGLLESFFYIGNRKQGKRIISDARKIIHNTQDLENWYKDNKFDKFEYRKDTVNCGSLPWVTAYRHKGDCEDYAILSMEILKDMCKCIIAVCHGRREGKRTGHAILLVQEGEKWRVMSNMYKKELFATKKEAALSTYGDKTTDYYFVGS